MLKLIFTWDYEIHGDGRGCPRELMVEPTHRLLQRLDDFGARLTVMCEVAEVLCFRRHLEQTARDDFAYEPIESQLRAIVAAGHDVQLHLHPGYLSARRNGKRWEIDPACLDLASMPPARVLDAVRSGKSFLEEILLPVDPSYRCVAFRSGLWSMQPSRTVVDALVSNGISIDTSVFKYGVRHGPVEFDYASAPSRLVPWPVDRDDVCRPRPGSQLIEFPIYAEHRPIWSFASRGRIERILRAARWSTEAPEGQGGRRGNPLRRHAWKADVNQCTGRQLIDALQRAEAEYADPSRTLPFVLIGHSKLFDSRNEGTLAPLLEFVSARPDRFGFGTFGDFDLETFRHRVPES